MAIYYISAASGNNGNSGLSESLAWATVDHSMNNVVAGDKVYVKNDGNYNETVTIDTVGTSTLPIIFEGYASVAGDNGLAIIDGQNTRANCVNDSLGIVNGFYIFKNFRFTDATNTSLATSLPLMKYKNCRFDNSTSVGATSALSTFEDCEFDTNGDTGVLIGNNCIFLGCKWAGNAVNDLQGDNNIVYGSTFFSAGEGGVVNTNPAEFVIVLNSTFDGDGKDTSIAIDTATGADKQAVVVNCILYDNATGVRSTFGAERLISRNNLFHNNTNKYGGTANTFTDEINGTPNFINESTNDYRLNTGSSGIKTGFDASKVHNFDTGMDIGAFQVLGTGLSLPSTQTSGNLFVSGKDFISNDIDITISGVGVINNDISLVLVYPSFSINSLNLFLQGPGEVTNNINLFLAGEISISNDIETFVHGKNTIFDNIGLNISAGFASNSCNLFIRGTTIASGVGDDSFGLELDILFKAGDFNPQIIGRFTTNPSGVNIEVWSVMDNNVAIVLLNDDCYEIADTDRWGWSTIYLPPLTRIVNQFVYRMTANTGETFEGDFILNTRRLHSYKQPENNDHIREI